MKSAIHIGITKKDYDEMTPYELGLAIQVFNEKKKQEQEDKLVLTYLGAYWQRVKKMPNINTILESKKTKKQMTAEEMFAQVKKLNAIFGGNKEEVKD